MSNIMPLLNKTLEFQIEKTMQNKPKNIKKKFKLALTPHKFESEIYIPKRIQLNKTQYPGKNYLINKVISFDSLYQPQKEKRLKIKKETDVFSQQYKPINDKKFYKKDNYLKIIEDKYKFKGYNMEDLHYRKKDNIFAPSILFKDSDHDLRMTCQIEPSYNIIKDNNFLSKVEESITNIKKNKSKNKDEEEKKRYRPKRTSVLTDDYINAIINVKEKIKEELKLQNMSLRQIRLMNNSLRNDIRQTNLSLNEANEENKKMIQRRKERKNMFLSNESLGNKKKRKDHIINLYKSNDEEKIMIIDTRDAKFIRKNKETSSEIKRKEEYEKEKNSRLENVYNDLLKTNFIIGEKEAVDYIDLYTDRKIPVPNEKIGSNLHGVFQEFQRRSNNINLPEKAKLINHTKRDIYNKTYSNIVDVGKKAFDDLQSHLYDVDKLKDEENKIENLQFEYSYDILKQHK